LAALQPKTGNITVQMGQDQLSVKPGSSPGQFVTESFDPGQLKESTALTVAVSEGERSITTQATLDVLPLPTWFNAIKPVTKSFDPAAKSYNFSGSFLNLSTNQLSGFSIPSDVWFGGGSKTSLFLQATVKVIAP